MCMRIRFFKFYETKQKTKVKASVAKQKKMWLSNLSKILIVCFLSVNVGTSEKQTRETEKMERESECFPL